MAVSTPLSPPSSQPEKEIKNKHPLLVKNLILTTQKKSHPAPTNSTIILPYSQQIPITKPKQQQQLLRNNDKEINVNNQTLGTRLPTIFETNGPTSSFIGKSLPGKQILLVQPNTTTPSNHSPQKQQQQRKRFKGQSGFDEKVFLSFVLFFYQ